MNTKFKENTKSYPSGKKNFFDFLRKKTHIKDLDGKILYEGRGSFQKVLEQAVREEVELPKADLRNRSFVGLQIPYAKLEKASFENSKFYLRKNFNTIKDLVNISFTKTNLQHCNLKGVSFKNCQLDPVWVLLNHSDVEKTDLDRCSFFASSEQLSTLKNFDKALNIQEDDLMKWRYLNTKVVNPNHIINPTVLKETALKTKQGR